MIPVVLFAYNRPEHLKKCLESLAKNKVAKQTDLITFIDYSEKQTDIGNIVKSFKGSFKSVTVHKWTKHIGCRRSVRGGLDIMFRQSESLIILEDDILVTSDFLEYMNDGLDTHKMNRDLFSISGTCPNVKTGEEDTFLYGRFWCHGWGSWRDRWNSIIWNPKDVDEFHRGGDDLNSMLKKAMKGKIDSWSIFANYASRNKYNVFPRVSKCTNVGYDGSGTNTKHQTKYCSPLSEERLYHGNPQIDLHIAKQIDDLFKRSLIRKFIDWVTL